MRAQLRKQFGNSMTAIPGAVQPKRVVKPDTVNLERIYPVNAGIADVFQGTPVAVIQILKERMFSEIANVRTVGGIFVKPVIGKSPIHSRSIGMVEYSVHYHMQVTVMAFADQPF